MWKRSLKLLATSTLIAGSVLNTVHAREPKSTEDCPNYDEYRILHVAAIALDPKGVPTIPIYSSCRDLQKNIDILMSHLTLFHAGEEQKQGDTVIVPEGYFRKELSDPMSVSCDAAAEYRVWRRVLLENSVRLDDKRYPFEIPATVTKRRGKEITVAPTCKSYQKLLGNLRGRAMAVRLAHIIAGSGTFTKPIKPIELEPAPTPSTSPSPSAPSSPAAPADVDATTGAGSANEPGPIDPYSDVTPTPAPTTTEAPVTDERSDSAPRAKALPKNDKQGYAAVAQPDPIEVKRAQYAPTGADRPANDDLTLEEAKLAFIDFSDAKSGEDPRAEGQLFGLVFDECKDLFWIQSSDAKGPASEFTSSGKIGFRITDRDGAGRACMKQLLAAKTKCSKETPCSRISTFKGAKLALAGNADGEAKLCRYDTQSDREPWKCESLPEPLKFISAATFRKNEKIESDKKQRELVDHYHAVIDSPTCHATEEGLAEVQMAADSLIALGEDVQVDINKDRLAILQKECTRGKLEDYQFCLEKLAAWADANPDDADKVADIYVAVAARFTVKGKATAEGYDIASSILSEAQALPLSDEKYAKLSNYMDFDIPVGKCGIYASQGWGRDSWGRPTNTNLMYCANVLIPYYANRSQAECQATGGMDPMMAQQGYVPGAGVPNFTGPTLPAGCAASQQATSSIAQMVQNAGLVDQQRMAMQQQIQQQIYASMNGGAAGGQQNMQAFSGQNSNLMTQAQTPSFMGNSYGNTGMGTPFWNTPYNSGVPGYGSNYNAINPLNGYGAYNGNMPMGNAGGRPFGA